MALCDESRIGHVAAFAEANPVRRRHDEGVGEFMQPLGVKAALGDQRRDDPVNDRDDAPGNELLVDGKLVRRRGLADIGEDPFDHGADGRVVFSGCHVVDRHAVLRSGRPAKLCPGVDLLLVGKAVAVVNQAGLVGVGVGADELQDRGAAFPRHGRRLALPVVPGQSIP
jgi:hypothetical protein